MSFDFYPQENADAFKRAAAMPSLTPEPGVWTNFIPGGGKVAMQGFAQVARTVDLLGAVGPIIEDKLTGGTAAQDQYFQEHDEVFNRAVDYWTPKPGEVGTAGRVVGGLIPMLPTAIVSPGLFAGSAGVGQAESLVREGVPLSKAAGVGAVQTAGAAAGVALPIFGRTLVQRLLAGVGTNVGQGVATNIASQKILEGEKQADQFNPWTAENLVIDSLMGAAFGGMAHLGAREITPSDKAAILGVNQARHMEDTTAPGLPATDVDLTAHTDAIKKAIDDLLNDRQVNVEQSLAGSDFRGDASRTAAQRDVSAAVTEQARASTEGADTTPIPEPERTGVSTEIPQPEGADPVVTEAERYVIDRPELAMHTGVDEAGNPTKQSLAEWFATQRDDVAQAHEDSKLFGVAAACLMGAA